MLVDLGKAQLTLEPQTGWHVIRARRLFRHMAPAEDDPFHDELFTVAWTLSLVAAQCSNSEGDAKLCPPAFDAPSETFQDWLKNVLGAHGRVYRALEDALVDVNAAPGEPDTAPPESVDPNASSTRTL